MEVNRTKQQQKKKQQHRYQNPKSETVQSLSAGSIACREEKTPEQVCSEDPTISGCEPPAPPIEQPQPIEGREVRIHKQEIQTIYVLTLLVK
ncbi:MAG: hypothetical protein M3156_07950 [Thermoproteota archaeon]|nr:hypothetical protein [Thermoproteota archaeon]